MSTVLLVIQIIIAIAMVAVILIQRSSSDGLGGLGGGGGNAFLSGRASANLLTRTTSILAALFIINSLTLGAIASRSSDRQSLIESIEQKNNGGQNTESTKDGDKAKPDAPSVPMAE